MRVHGRIERIERRVRAASLGDSVAQRAVEIWLPDNGWSGRPPGRYPLPGSHAVLVIYEPEEEPPGGGPQA